MAVARDSPAPRRGAGAGWGRAAFCPLPPLGGPFCTPGRPGGPPLPQVGDMPWPAAYDRSRIRRNGRCDGAEPRDAGLSPDRPWAPCSSACGASVTCAWGTGADGGGRGDPARDDRRRMRRICSRATSAAVVCPGRDQLTAPRCPAILARGRRDSVRRCADGPPRKPAGGLSFRKAGRGVVGRPSPFTESEVGGHSAVALAIGKVLQVGPGRATGRTCQCSGYIPVVALLLALLLLPPPCPPLFPSPHLLPT